MTPGGPGKLYRTRGDIGYASNTPTGSAFALFAGRYLMNISTDEIPDMREDGWTFGLSKRRRYSIDSDAESACPRL